MHLFSFFYIERWPGSLSYCLYGCYGLTSLAVANLVKDVDANDVFDYFLNLDTATFPSLTELEKNTNPYTIASLNEALSVDIIIVEKDINVLTDALYGRKFKPDQLKGIFRQWLDKASLPWSEVYIAISDSRESDRSPTGWNCQPW